MSVGVKISLLVFVVLWCAFWAALGYIESKQNARFYAEHCKGCGCNVNCRNAQEDTDEG